MTGIDRISTELIQQFTSSQAWEYLLVPKSMDGTILECYGDSARDYTSQLIEIKVLYNFDVKVCGIDLQMLQKLLSQYYRIDEHIPNSQKRSINEIRYGQGFLKSLIDEAFGCYASDIHIETYDGHCRIRFRIDGKLIERYVVAKGNYASLINQIKIMANLDISEKRLPQDGRILFNQDGKKFDLRVSSLPTIYGEKIVLRLLTRHIELLELENLGFDQKQLADYCSSIEKPHGLVLICGPTGSGKSTTLYATLRRLNKETGNIMTIEDPVEYTLQGVNQVQLKEEIGLNFTSALRSFLRQDPDIIMLGEIRDSETAQMAIRSALTGHMIFSTIHTNSAWGCVSRLVDMGIHPYLISDTLVMCVAQRLIRQLCTHCKKEENLPSEAKKYLGEKFDCEKHFLPVGCDRCYYTGYRGRRAIYEVVTIDNEFAEAIKTNEAGVEQLFKAKGILSLKEAAIKMFSHGETSLTEILPIINS